MKRSRASSTICVAALGLLLLAGCAGMDEAGAKDDGRPDGGSAADAMNPSLTISVSGSAVPKTGESVTLVAILNHCPYAPKQFDWIVNDPKAAAVQVTKNALGDQITFKPAAAGTYNVSCTATLEGGFGTLSANISLQVDDGGKKLSYTARILPAASSGLPPKDIVVEVGAVAQTGLSWQLESGKEVTVKVTDSSAGALPTVVRLLQPGQDPQPRDVYLVGGSGKARVAGTFHALFLPDSSLVPPDVQANVVAGSLGATWSIALSPGSLVQGLVKKSDGTSLGGATITLYTTSSAKTNDVDLPSTAATTASDGTFSVRCRPGTAQVTVVPPEDSGLPVAVMDKTGLDVSGSSSGWTFSFASAQPVTLTGQVKTSTGAAAAAGAKVVLSTSITASVGTLQAPGGTVTAKGLYRRVLSATSSGELLDPKTGAQQVTVPQGDYLVEVWPGSGESEKEGYYAVKQTLSGPSADLKLKLATRAALLGKVVDQDGLPVQARVEASATTGSFYATSDANGSFSLYLNDQMSYSLLIRSTSKKVSTYIDPALKVAGSKDLSTIKLPRAVALAGTLTTSGGYTVSGSLIRIWCSGSDCASHRIVDETRVSASGFFELRVPPTEGAK